MITSIRPDRRIQRFPGRTLIFPQRKISHNFGGLSGDPRDVYGEIYAMDVAATITISASGVANKVQVTCFDTNGLYRLAKPDHTNDHIEIQKSGVYDISAWMNVDSVAGPAAQFGFNVCLNNGATILPNLHGHHDFAGGGGEQDNLSMGPAKYYLAVGDTVEIWCWNYTGTENTIVDDIGLSLTRIRAC